MPGENWEKALEKDNGYCITALSVRLKIVFSTGSLQSALLCARAYVNTVYSRSVSRNRNPFYVLRDLTE